MADKKVSGRKKSSGKKISKKQKEENRKSFLTILAGVALGIVLVFSIVAVDLVAKMGLISFSSKPGDDPAGFVEVTEAGDEEIHIDQLQELRGQSDLSSVLKSWAENTTENSLMRDKDVINFLLIGLDASNRNSDAIILVSLNKKTEKIYLTSVFRDCYTYISTSSGGKYAKINACYANGGAKKLIETLQNNFKIKIDYYVSVNFDSFSAIVDALGGITLDVKEYEAAAVRAEINDDCPSGENVLLNGKQALGFCRIRYCDPDADVSRTRRQRQFINALIDEAKGITISQISPLLNSVIKYVKTDCSVAKIISLGTQALSDKWYNYEIISEATPSEENRLDYQGYSWVWIVDYPAAAKALHETIYGTSNIELKEDRVSAIDIMRYSAATGTARP